MVAGSTLLPRRNRLSAGFTLVELMFSTTIFAAVSAALLMGFISLKRNYAATMDFAVNHADAMRISDYLALDFRRALSVLAAADQPNDITVYVPAFYTPRAAGERELSQQARDPVIDGHLQVFYGPAAAASTTAPLPACTYSDYTTTSAAKLTGIGLGQLVINGYSAVAGDTVFVKEQTNTTENGLYVVTNPGGVGIPWVLTRHAVKIHYYLAGSVIYRDQQGEADQPVALASDVQDFIFKRKPKDPSRPTDYDEKVVETVVTFRPTFRRSGVTQQIEAQTGFHNLTLLRNKRGIYF